MVTEPNEEEVRFTDISVDEDIVYRRVECDNLLNLTHILILILTIDIDIDIDIDYIDTVIIE